MLAKAPEAAARAITEIVTLRIVDGGPRDEEDIKSSEGRETSLFTLPPFLNTGPASPSYVAFFWHFLNSQSHVNTSPQRVKGLEARDVKRVSSS